VAVRRYLRLRSPEAKGPRIETPPWALERSTEVAREIAAALRASGVNVIGDLERLAEIGASASDSDAAPAYAQRQPATPALPWNMRTTLLFLRLTEPIARRRRRRA
jgi:hypothetical protein